MKTKILLLTVLLAIPFLSFAQTARYLTGSGLDKLNIFLGVWKSENTSAGAPAISGISTIRWSANKKFLIADQIITNDKTVTNNLSIYSYNPDKDDYTLSLVGIPGMAPFSIEISCSADTLIYHSDYTGSDGKKVYSRTLNTFTSTTNYTYQVQSSTDNINWTTSMEGESIKIAK